MLDSVPPYYYYLFPGVLGLAALPFLLRSKPASSLSSSSSSSLSSSPAMPPPEHTVVILGAGFVGVATAHHLLKHTPAHVATLKVVLVAPNDALYWNVAAPRGFLPTDDDNSKNKNDAKGCPGFGDDKLFYPLAPAFAAHAATSATGARHTFEHLVGRAARLDPDAQTVDVALLSGGAASAVAYDTLLVATGSDAVGGMPFKNVSSGGTAATKAALQRYRAAVQAASHIVVAGGGMTGVELAGELGHAYGQKKQKEVVLIVSEAAPLAVYGAKESVQQQALAQLTGLGVKVVAGTRVTGTEAQGGKTVLSLAAAGAAESAPETLTTDLYIPAFGIAFNTQFVPEKLLDTSAAGRRRVRTRTTLQAEGYDNIFVAGDVANLQAPSLKNADAQVAVLATQLQTHLASLAAKEKEGKAALKEYPVDPSLVVAVSIGPGGGTGQVGSWRLYSFVLWLLKARFLGTQNAADIAAGNRTISNSKW